MSAGYRRVEPTGWGRGAADVVAAVLAEVPATELASGPVRVGSIAEVFDRSAYLRFADAFTTGVSVGGPRLVLLGPATVAGPITVELDEPVGGGVDLSSLVAGASCHLHRTTIGESADYVLAVGDALEIVFEAPSPTTDPSPSVPGVVLDAIHADSPVWATARATLDWLVATEHEDGLGWLRPLAAVASGADTDHELIAVTTGWRRFLAGETDQIPGTVLEILGRGPGATPAGDDITAGMLLTLGATTDDRRRDRVLEAGDQIVAAAGERTTTVSTALLAQASRGRMAPTVATALEGVLSPAVGAGRRRTAVETVTDHGHTSGVDLVVGMLATVLMIGPRIAGGSTPR